MYQIFGFVECDDDSFEKDYIKIAIYADENNIVKHATRQLHTEENIWASKLGDEFVIKHKLHSLESKEYGKVVCIMKRHISIKKTNFRNIIES